MSADPMQRLRWGFLGASRIGRRALAPAVHAAGQTLHAVAARDLDRAKAFANEFSAPRAYGSYADLIEDRDIDAVYIALTNDAHLPWTRRALAAGKHVLCEKPLAMSAAEVMQMVEAERVGGCRVLEAFGYRFNHQIVRLQALMRTASLGRLITAHVSFTATMPPEDFRWAAPLGGGALFDIGCYCVDLLRLVFDDEPVRVSAIQRARGDVDASLGGWMEFANGALGQFSCAFDAARSQHLTVAGSHGALSLDWPFAPREPMVRLVVDGAAEIFGPSEPYRDMVAHFEDAVRERTKLRHPLAKSLAQARTLDALFESARRSGQVVTVTS